MTAGADPPLKTTFVEEQHLALRVPQVQFPIRQSEWEHLRLILLRCKGRERTFDGALWGTTSISISATLATFGFMVVKAAPEWIMRTSIAIATGAGVAAVVLGIVQRLVRTQKVTSIDDALQFMEECEQAFGYNGVGGSSSPKP